MWLAEKVASVHWLAGAFSPSFLNYLVQWTVYSHRNVREEMNRKHRNNTKGIGVDHVYSPILGGSWFPLCARLLFSIGFAGLSAIEHECQQIPKQRKVTIIIQASGELLFLVTDASRVFTLPTPPTTSSNRATSHVCSRHGRERRKVLEEKPVKPARSIQPKPVKPVRQGSRKLDASHNKTFLPTTVKEESVEQAANKTATLVSIKNKIE